MNCPNCNAEHAPLCFHCGAPISLEDQAKRERRERRDGFYRAALAGGFNVSTASSLVELYMSAADRANEAEGLCYHSEETP